jgi:hypothetical protein
MGQFGEISKKLQKMRVWNQLIFMLGIAVIFPVARANGDQLVMFPRGLRLVTVDTGIAEQPTGLREQLVFSSVGLNYYFADNWAFGVEFTGLGGFQPQQDVAAGGGDILLRTHLWGNQWFSFYGDFTAGVLEADGRIPPSGTDFNFTVRTGVGAAIKIDRRTDFFLGLRYFHLSNARQHGPDRNPSLNAIEGYAGIMFRM